jgi:hypothetical protein
MATVDKDNFTVEFAERGTVEYENEKIIVTVTMSDGSQRCGEGPTIGDAINQAIYEG